MNQRLTILLCAALALGFPQTITAAQKGDVMPDCALSAGDASRYNLKSLQGNVLYIDFWASWCGPCGKSFPFLNHLDDEFKTRGLQIVGINLDENPSDASAFLAKYPAHFRVATGDNQQCATAFGVTAMPSSYLVDRRGRIRHLHLGFRPGDTEELKGLLGQLLSEQ